MHDYHKPRWNRDPFYIALFLFIIVIVVAVFDSKEAKAINEYLNQGSQHCSKGSVEPYIEYRKEDRDSFYRSSPTSDNRFYGENGTIGLRFRWELGSTCTDDFQKIMLDNQKLKQELELLKLCRRFLDLELGPEFATVREKCKDVRKSDEAIIRDENKREKERNKK